MLKVTVPFEKRSDTFRSPKTIRNLHLLSKLRNLQPRLTFQSWLAKETDRPNPAVWRKTD